MMGTGAHEEEIDMLAPDEYRKALEAARDEWHSKNHPFFKSWAAGELSQRRAKGLLPTALQLRVERIPVLRDPVRTV